LADAGRGLESYIVGRRDGSSRLLLGSFSAHAAIIRHIVTFLKLGFSVCAMTVTSRRRRFNLRQQGSILLMFLIAIVLAFYAIYTAPTLEQELFERRQQRGYGIAKESGDTTTWYNISGQPDYRAVPNTGAIDDNVPLVMFLPLPAQTIKEHRDSASVEHVTATLRRVAYSEDDMKRKATFPLGDGIRQGSRAMSLVSSGGVSDSFSYSSKPSQRQVGAVYYYVALLAAVLAGALSEKRTLDRWTAWEADRQEDGFAYDIAYTTTTHEIGYGYGEIGYGSFVHSDWTG